MITHAPLTPDTYHCTYILAYTCILYFVCTVFFFLPAGLRISPAFPWKSRLPAQHCKEIHWSEICPAGEGCLCTSVYLNYYLFNSVTLFTHCYSCVKSLVPFTAREVCFCFFTTSQPIRFAQEKWYWRVLGFDKHSLRFIGWVKPLIRRISSTSVPARFPPTSGMFHPWLQRRAIGLTEGPQNVGRATSEVPALTFHDASVSWQSFK